MSTARFKFLRKPFLALCPWVSVKGRFQMQQRMRLMAVRDYVQLHIPAAFGSLPNHDVLFDDVTLPIEMFSD